MKLTITGIQNIAISYVALWATSPFLAFGEVYRLAAVISVLVWAGLELQRAESIFYKPTLPVLLTLVYISYTATIQFMLEGAASLVLHFQIWSMLFFLIVQQSRRNDPLSLKMVFWVVLVTMPIWLFLTFDTLVSENSHAARLAVRASEEAEELANKGVGGYALVYASILLFPSLLMFLLSKAKGESFFRNHIFKSLPRSARWIVFLNILLVLLVVFTAGYSIAVITFLLSTLCAFILKKYSFSRVMAIFMMGLVVATVFQPFMEALLTALLPLAEGTNFAVKIKDLLDSLQVGDAVGSAAERVERYTRSLTLFFENPLIGVLAVDDVGKHSQILDAYARWGIFFGCIFVYLLVFLPIKLLKKPQNNFGCVMAVLVSALSVFILNNGFSAAGLMLYIMFPVAYQFILDSKRLNFRAAG
ncbi:MAG: hypothetical protein VW548_05200 [Methylotenera sp.]